MKETKKDENYQGLVPVGVEVAFDSKVKAELFTNKQGTIVGPEGTETIISMSEVVKASYKVEWKKEELIVSKREITLPV